MSISMYYVNMIEYNDNVYIDAGTQRRLSQRRVPVTLARSQVATASG